MEFLKDIVSHVNSSLSIALACKGFGWHLCDGCGVVQAIALARLIIFKAAWSIQLQKFLETKEVVQVFNSFVIKSH